MFCLRHIDVFTHYIARAALMLGLLVAAGACAPAAPPITAQEAAQGTGGDYRLGSGDKLRVIVFDEPTLSGDFEVGANGAIALPLAGSIDAGNQTPASLAAMITNRLAGKFVLAPKVSVEVLEYRPYYILGEVTKPGEYPFSAKLSLYQVVARAGGFTPRADTHKLLLRRANWNGERVVRLDDPDVVVAPGDTIRVLESYF